MGLVYADIEMKNSFDVMLFENGNIKEAEIKKINVSAMVDSGATMLSISENVCKKLGLKIKETRNSQLADGTVIEVGVTGPIELFGGFSAALALARASDLIASVPERHTGNLRAGMHSFPLPVRVPEVAVSLLWHPRLDADLAHRWLRKCVRDACA